MTLKVGDKVRYSPECPKKYRFVGNEKIETITNLHPPHFIYLTNLNSGYRESELIKVEPV